MLKNYLNSKRWFIFLNQTRGLHFFLVGVTGVALNLTLTALFAEFVFGRANYFNAYLIGLFANLLYNFVLHTRVTFKTRGNHVRRLCIFFVYSLALAYLQAQIIKYLTDLVGVNWYIVVISSVIFVFSFVTFILFKFVLFKNENDKESGQV